MAFNHNRLTIGVLVSGIMDSFTKLLCKGIIQQAEKEDINIVVFPGKYLDRDFSSNPDIRYEYQFSTVFSYVKKENIDGIISATNCIGCFAKLHRMEKFMHQFDGIPCVLAASKMSGYVNVHFDNVKGLEDGIKYLIVQSGCRKIGMIGGPLDNSDNIERRDTYLRMLKEYGLEFNPKQYVEGDLTSHCTAAFRTLLDDNPDLDAIVCVNDDTAIGLYKELKQRGIMPGRDISVLGYDNVLASASVFPTLSTVMADASEIGRESVKMLLKVIDGKLGHDVKIPTRFIRRESIKYDDTDTNEYSDPKNINSISEYFDDIFYHSNFEQNLEFNMALRNSFNTFIYQVLTWPHSPAGNKNDYIQIMESMDSFLNQDSIKYIDMDNFLMVIYKLYQNLKKSPEYVEHRIELTGLFSSIYQKTIHIMNYYVGNLKNSIERTNYDMKLFVSAMLNFEKGTDQSYSSLLTRLDWLEISNAFLYLFENPVIHLQHDDFSAPEYIFLKAMRCNNTVSAVPFTEQKTPLKDIFSRVVNKEHINHFVLLPLYFNEMLYGFILCDLTNGIFENGDFLCSQLSSGAKMIELLRSNETIQRQLEDSLVALRHNNIELDTLSKSDALTGILNRRGFYEAAETLCSKYRDNGQTVLVIYADMNNLKIINDRYGHDEGDYSINIMSTILKDLMADTGIVGRLGGDEFACVYPINNAQEAVDFPKHLYDTFNDFNKTSPKPYCITISAGAYPLEPENNISLHDALALADERLYEVKKFRIKDIVKKEWAPPV